MSPPLWPGPTTWNGSKYSFDRVEFNVQVRVGSAMETNLCPQS